MSRRRVLVVCEFPTTSGGERSLLASLLQLEKAGFEVQVAAPAEGPLAVALDAMGIARHAFDVRDAEGNRQDHDAIARRLAEIVTTARPALLHANSLAMGRVVGPLARELGVPAIAHLRDIVRMSRAAVAALNQHTRILAVSEATRAYHVAQGVDAALVRVAYNGVDLSAFRPRAATGRLHAELGIERSAAVIGCVGQVVLRKGQDTLAAAAEAIVAARPATHFVIVGERYSQKAEAVWYEENVRHSFREACGDERVHFVGWRDDIVELLPELTVLVHPARQEPLGRVLLEAAACGVPVVATDVGGTREIFGDESAVLVPADDAAAMAEAVCELLADAARRKRLAVAARRVAEAKFDIRAAGERLAQHYDEVAGEAQR